MNGITDTAYSKLNGTQRNYLMMMSELIERARNNGLVEETESRRGKVRGYLTCLHQMQIITETESKALYLFFVTKNRSY